MTAFVLRQMPLFDAETREGKRLYRPVLTASENQKGVLDVDTVKGCTMGMRAYRDGGCYNECYAAKTASRYGIDFTVSVSRLPAPWAWRDVFCKVRDYHASWYRIGTAGDPCHDWENTIAVCEMLKPTGKQPVIITKHWIKLTDQQCERLARVDAVINTSTSGLDTDAETKHRVKQIDRMKAFGMRSVNRVVTCKFGTSEWARSAQKKQEFLLTLGPVIDNPLRATRSHPRVVTGDILLDRHDDAVGGGKLVSLHDPQVYLGTCGNCPDQCGAKK